MSKTVSIIIPSYNSSKCISDTIISILYHKCTNIEVILVDDGSTDTTLDVANKYPIKIIQQKNSGACSARNYGYNESKGHYIQFLDADDLLSPDKIINQLKFFEKYGDEIIVTGPWDRFYKDQKEAAFPNRFLDKDWENPIDWLVHSWEGKGMGQTATWLTPRKLIEKAGPWDERLLINQDGEFFNRVLMHAKSIKFCPEAKVYYRSGNPQSISQSMNRNKAESLLLSYQLYVHNTLPFYDNQSVRHALMMNFLTFMYQHYHFSDLREIARNEIQQLGFKKLELTGGKNFRILAGLIGFENALKAREFLKKF